MQQRKFRNREEREAIRLEIALRAQETGVGQVEGFGEFAAILDAFVEDGSGRMFSGAVELPSVEARIEYSLPGRRLLRHVTRVVSTASAPPSGAASGTATASTSGTTSAPPPDK